MSALLTAEGIVVRRGGRVLVDGVALSLQPGRCVALCGPNGAGKSTLLQVLAGLSRPDAGSLTLFDRPLAGWEVAELAKVRAVVGQHANPAHGLQVRDVVALGLRCRGMHGRALRDRTDAVLAMAGLANLASRAFAVLSGGERQRVHLCRALAQLPETGPALLFLDEPTASLDVRHQFRVLEQARERAAQGAAVVAVLHDLNQAAQWADELHLLQDGRLVADGPPAQVLTADRVAAVWGQPCAVLPHPTLAAPLLVPLAHAQEPLAAVALAHPCRSPA